MPGIGFNIDVRDRATPAVRALVGGMRPQQLQPLLGRSARNLTVSHLRAVDAARPNKLGGERTNFYARAADATQFRVEGDFVIVSINHVGIGLRYFGGTVRPRTRKYLTIPASAEAHGKRASEFPDLKFAIVPDPKTGRARAALVRRGANEVSLIRTVRVRGRNVVRRAEQAVGYVVFWLVRETTHQPDPSVLPTQQEFADHLGNDVAEYARLLVARSQGDRN
jgi:hypothetical protein